MKKSTIPVILSEAKDLQLLVFKKIMQMLRCAQHDTVIFSQLLSRGTRGGSLLCPEPRQGRQGSHDRIGEYPLPPLTGLNKPVRSWTHGSRRGLNSVGPPGLRSTSGRPGTLF